MVLFCDRSARINIDTKGTNLTISVIFGLNLKEGSGVRQKHNCLGIVLIAAMVTTCFGRAWPSSGHNVDVLHK
jgi:hypothetical protein